MIQQEQIEIFRSVSIGTWLRYAKILEQEIESRVSGSDVILIVLKIPDMQQFKFK